MQFGSNTDHEFEELRSAIAKAGTCATSLTAGERGAIASLYWEVSVRERIAARDYEGAWHRIQAAALGAAVFEGPDRICRPHLEGEPVGLIAPSSAIMGYIHLLYYAMRHDAAVSGARIGHERRAWGPLFQSGNRIAMLMDKRPQLPFLLASAMATVIAEWVNNYRRLTLAA